VGSLLGLALGLLVDSGQELSLFGRQIGELLRITLKAIVL